MALPNGDLITTPFDPQMAYPSDRRMQVDTLNARDSISMFIRWEGMPVYVLENSKIYILQGGRSNEFWKELGTGSGTGGTTFVGQFPTADLLPTNGRSAGDYAFVGTGDDFVQYNWDNIGGQWVMAEGQTDMASEFFHIGYKTPLRRPVIFPLFPKDVLVEDSGDFVFAPETAVGRFIFVGEVEAIRGIETAAADRENKYVNRTGSDIILRDKASGIPSGSGMDFGGTDYTWVNGSEITLKGNGAYWELAPNNQIAFSDHLDSVNAQVSVGSDGLEVISGILDVNKSEISIKQITQYYDGSVMDDSKVDGFLYFKVGSKYYLNTLYTRESIYLIKKTITELRNLSNIDVLLLKFGYYKSVQLEGYYEEGDTPYSINYFVSDTLEPDNGGTVIRLPNITLVAPLKTIDPLFFGAKGDGVFDCSDILETILNIGLPVSSSSTNHFRVSRPIVSTAKIDINGLNVKLDGAALTSNSGIRFNESAVKTGLVNNSTTINELSRSIVVDSSSGIEKGDLIVIKCLPQTSGNIIVGRTYVIMSEGGNFASVGAPNNNVGTSFVATSNTPNYQTGSLLILWPYDPRPGETNVTYGEVHKITRIDGNELILDIPLMSQYSSTFNVGYTIYRPSKCSISSLNLYADNASDVSGISVGFKDNPVISNSTFSKVSGRVGISIGNCYMAKVTNCDIVDGYYDGTPTGYGIQDNGSTGTQIVFNNFRNNRRGVDFSGGFPSHMGVVSNCLVVSNTSLNSSGSGLGGHGGADLITFENNKLIGGIIGIQIRGGRNTIRGNEFVGQSICCVSLNFVNSVTIEGNKVVKSNNYSSLLCAFFVQMNNTTSFSKENPLIIRNNEILELRKALIGFNSNENIDTNGLIITNNKLMLRSNASINKVGIIVNDLSGIITVKNSLIEKNNITAAGGDYANFHNVVFYDKLNAGDVYEFQSNDVEKWSGSGNITNIHVSLNQTIGVDGVCNLNGQIRFDIVDGSARIKVKNVGSANNDELYFYSAEGFNCWITNSGELYIGSENGDSYTSPIPIGTYSVNISIIYQVRSSYKY